MSSRSAPALVVVDVGNTRVKWGLCDASAVVHSASLPPDAPDAWQQQIDAWHPTGPLRWAVSGVHPARRDRLAEWLRQRGDAVHLLQAPAQLPLQVALEHPERAGIDRLLNAVAANSRRRPDCAAVLIDAGSAVTVDCVDQHGIFRGGAILPGFRLMAAALHEHTALLPVVEVVGEVALPATTTTTALQAGVFLAVVGGVREALVRIQGSLPRGTTLQVFVTGGDGPWIAVDGAWSATPWPLMTLEGLRLTALWQGTP